MPLPTSPHEVKPGVCSKPKGEFCRLHNPAPAGFKNLNDVFVKADAGVARKPGQGLPTRVDNARFQPYEETRVLDEKIPQEIKDHIELSNEGLAHLSDEERKALRGYTGFSAGVCNNVLQGKTYEYYDKAPLWREADGGPCDFISREDLVDYMETMDSILAPRQPERRMVYRGIPIYSSLHDEIGDSIGKKLSYKDEDGLAEGLAEYYKPGKVFKYDTYMSTTHSANYAAERSANDTGTKRTYYDQEARIKGIVFEMKTNAGLDVTGAARHNAYEREVVLPRETYFKVVSVKVAPQEYDTVSGFDHDRGRKKELQSKETFYGVAAIVQMVEVDSEGRILNTAEPHKPKKPISTFIPEG